MKALILCALLLATGFAGCSGDEPAPTQTTGGCAQPGFKALVYVNVTTNKGEMVWELRGDKAPITVCNILQYVNEKFYDNTCFHRIVKGFVDQGGGFEKDKCNASRFAPKANHAPIKLETGGHLRNYEATLAMARTGDPNSATSQFFINVANNSKGNHYDLDWDGQQAPGYAVFGRVVSGYQVAKAIEGTPTDGDDVPTQSVYVSAMRVDLRR